MNIVVPTSGSLLTTVVNFCSLRGVRADARAISGSLVFLAPVYTATGAGFVDDHAGQIG